jgi:tetratricopeptide (TPR) repeat protein
MTTIRRLAVLAAMTLPLWSWSAVAETSSELTADDLPLSLSGSYLAGRSADAQHDIVSALTFFDQAADNDVGNPILLERVLTLRLANGDIDVAVDEARKLVAVDNGSPLGRLTVAIAAIKKGDYAGADSDLAKSARSPLGTLTNGLLSAWMKDGQNQIDTAFATIEGLSGPNWYGIFKSYHKALIADVAGRKDTALAAIKEANSTDGAALRVVDAYARIVARNGDRNEAIRAVKAFAGDKPSHPVMKALMSALKNDQPIEALAATPQDGAAEVLYGLGSAIGLEDGAELPAAYLQLAHYLNPKDDLIVVALGDIFQATNACGKAIQIYGEVPETSPLRRNSEIQLGNCLDAMDKPDEGAAHMRAVIMTDPSDIEAVVALGNLYRGRERFVEAADAYSLGIATITDPDHSDWRIYYFRGVSLERSKRWPEAEADFRQALKIDPEQPQVLNYLGYSWVDQGTNLDQALNMIKTAVDLRPEDGYIVDSLGWAYFKLARYDDAVTQLERAVELKSSDPVINDHLGDAYWKVGRKLEARFQWNHARDLKPEPDELPKILKKIEQGLVEDSTRQFAENKDAAPVANDAAQQVAAVDAKDGTPAAVSFTVSRGDTLWTIAARVYGDADLFNRIFEANRDKIRSPDRIFPGMTLTIPAKGAN